uniref:Uncharacterized protein n=1 Tax=Oryza nivara TaxID=4536 RepID=A0A0E0J4B3_ORYNI
MKAEFRAAHPLHNKEAQVSHVQHCETMVAADALAFHVQPKRHAVAIDGDKRIQCTGSTSAETLCRRRNLAIDVGCTRRQRRKPATTDSRRGFQMSTVSGVSDGSR